MNENMLTIALAALVLSTGILTLYAVLGRLWLRNGPIETVLELGGILVSLWIGSGYILIAMVLVIRIAVGGAQ